MRRREWRAKSQLGRSPSKILMRRLSWLLRPEATRRLGPNPTRRGSPELLPMNVTIIQDDAPQQADALVNAAGTSHKMGSGVAGVLRHGAGGDSNAETMASGPVDPGDIVATDAYDLDAEYVIHAAAMPHDGDGQATTESIRGATQNFFERAEELWCESILIPILGIGVAGFDTECGAELICSVIAEHKSSTLTDARVIAYSDSEYESLQSVADTIQD